MVVPWSWSIRHDDFVTAVWSVVCSFSLLAIIMSDVVRVLFVKLKVSSKELKTNSTTTIFSPKFQGWFFRLLYSFGVFNLSHACRYCTVLNANTHSIPDLVDSLFFWLIIYSTRLSDKRQRKKH